MNYFLTMILTCLLALSVMATADVMPVDKNKLQCSVNMLQAKYLQFVYLQYEQGYTMLEEVYRQEEEKSWALVEELALATERNDVDEFNAIQERMIVNSDKLNEIKDLFKLTREAAIAVDEAFTANKVEFFETYDCKQYELIDMVQIIDAHCSSNEPSEQCEALAR